MAKRVRGDDGDARAAAPVASLHAAIEGVRAGIESLLQPLLASIQENGALSELQAQLNNAAAAAKEGVDDEYRALTDRKTALDAEIVTMTKHAGAIEDVIKLNRSLIDLLDYLTFG